MAYTASYGTQSVVLAICGEEVTTASREHRSTEGITVRASLLLSVTIVNVSFLLGGCTESGDPAFTIVDSGVHAWDHERPLWLDDKRVLVVGFAGDKPKSREESRRMFPSLYIWDVEAREVTLYRENARRLCYVDGFVRYVIPERNEVGGHTAGVQGWYEGPLGWEIYTEGSGHRSIRDGWRFSDNSCTYRAVPENLHRATWDFLRPEHGIIVYRQSDEVGQPRA
jgi:hypothetical protein